MEQRTQGAWLIHHTNKLKSVQNIGSFEEVNTAGKCGLLLSGLAESHNECTISNDKVVAISKTAGISKLELGSVLDILAEEKLINKSRNGDVAVLGITTTGVLNQTSEIFAKLNPSKEQLASLEISEAVSDKPLGSKFLKEYVGDSFKLSKDEVSELVNSVEEVGFIDSEQYGTDEKVFFNGNLFKKNFLEKTNAVLSSLSTEDIKKLHELDDFLKKNGCVPLDKGIQILGKTLLEKLQSIGMYDFNKVANNKEEVIFITKPAAFGKFGNPFEEDALDLAKAFVSALTYGMVYSFSGRGKITMLKRLMTKLINGGWVGSATAIGEDYKVLEYKRVVELKYDEGGKYYMRLLKKEVGELAMQVLDVGDTTEQTVLSLNSGSVSLYTGPESNRINTRKKQNAESKKEILDTLRTLRV